MGGGRRGWVVLALLVAVFGVGGLVLGRVGPSRQDLVVTVLLYAYWATAWNILGGMAGQLSFGHAAFIGAGAYTSSILFVQFGVNPWLGMFAGAALAAILGVAVGYLSFRYGLRDVYFSLTTLAFGEIVFLLIANTDYHGLFGGQGGVRFPVADPSPRLFQFATKLGYYWVIAALLAIAIGLTWWLRRSRVGYYLIAIRENERAAQAIGINITRYKLVATALSAFLAAFGGTFYAQYYLFIDPASVVHGSLSIAVLLPAIVGGMDTLLGPVVGAIILIPISEQIRTSLSGGTAGAHLVVYGLVIILVMRFVPQGLVGWLHERGWFRRRPSASLPPAAARPTRA
jgi:branched-chain amino acid transport system permease protein